MRMKKLQKDVAEILTSKPETRNSDTKLYLEILKKINPTFVNQPFCEVFGNKNLPKYDSVSRARRKLQELYPCLRADSNVEAAREVAELEYIEYARNTVR